MLLKKVLQINSKKLPEFIDHIQEFLKDKKDVTYEEIEVKLDRSQKTSYLPNNLQEKLKQRKYVNGYKLQSKAPVYCLLLILCRSRRRATLPGSHGT